MGTAPGLLTDNSLPLMYEPQQAPPPGTRAPYEIGTPKGAAAIPEQSPQDYGPNNEKLPKKLQLALSLLLTMFVNEGMKARRDEVKKCRLAREFWKGLQIRYFSDDGQWHLPWDTGTNEDSSGDEPRYAFVTNYYQAFGLSIMAVLSQDVPAVRCWPQNPDQPEDKATSEAATDVIELVERNNRMPDLMLDEAFYLWTDGKIGAYVRYVCDGSRFGFKEQEEMDQRLVPFGEDSYECPECGQDTPASQYMGVCQQCGTELGPDNLRPAEQIPVPIVQQTFPTPNGAEVIDIVGGMELKTPPWAKDQHQFPYLIWDQLAHRAKLKAAFPWAAKKIGGAAIAPEDSNAQYERTAQITLVSGGEMEPIGAAGDLTQNLITYRQGWLRPWAFELLEDEKTTQDLYATFPTGVYVGFAGDVYCCSRNESMDDHWRIMHALPGDGQNRPAIGTSYISVQERYNTLANLVMETIEHGIPATWASPAVVDFDAIRESYVEPGAIYPATAAPGTTVRDSFFEQTPASVKAETMTHMQQLAGQTGQFLTGAFPALFGGEMEGNDTASGYSMARDQAMGRIGLVWRRMKQFHADLMLLAVDVFRKNRPDDVLLPVFGPGGQTKAKWIRKADLKGNIFCHPESDQQYPTMWSQQRATLMQLLQSPDPKIQEVLGHPENLALIKRLIGLEDLVQPDEESANKQLAEIEQLLEDGEQGIGPIPGQPIVQPDPQTGTPMMDPQTGGPMMGQAPPQSSVEVDPILDNHEVEFETIAAWANSEAGRMAKQTNPMGFLNVRTHALEHYQILQQQQMQAALAQAAAAAPPSGKKSPASGSKPPAQGAA